MLKNIYAALLISIISLLGTSAHAGIFKWIDANGLTHYGDNAPKKQQVERLDTDGLNIPIEAHQNEQEMQKADVFYDLQLIGKKSERADPLQKAAPDPVPEPKLEPEEKPDLFAVEYDIKKTPQAISQRPINTIRNRLCTDTRMLRAALQEQGFASYFDEEGNYQLDWGTHEIYKGKRQYLNEQQVTKIAEEVNLEVGQYCDDPDDQKLQEEARADWIRSEYCNVSKALLVELENPVKRTTQSEISNQLEEVERFCADLKPGEHRGNDRYYPKALAAKFINNWHR